MSNYNINKDLFRKFSPENKLKMVKEFTDNELLSAHFDTVERMVKEAGSRISEHHVAKVLYIDRDIASNHWNSNINSVFQNKKDLILNVYIQGYDTDTTVEISLKKILNGTEVLGEFEESYFNGGKSHIMARYDAHDRANVIKAICLAYVKRKYKISE